MENPVRKESQEKPVDITKSVMGPPENTLDSAPTQVDNCIPKVSTTPPECNEPNEVAPVLRRSEWARRPLTRLDL